MEKALVCCCVKNHYRENEIMVFKSELTKEEKKKVQATNLPAINPFRGCYFSPIQICHTLAAASHNLPVKSFQALKS